jgi:hypothetical protein
MDLHYVTLTGPLELYRQGWQHDDEPGRAGTTQQAAGARATARGACLMGRRSRDKGQRIERELVHLHLDAGIPASRVPLSGAHGGDYAGDVRIGDFTAEVKARANGAGFKQLETWLGDHDMLFLRRDRQRPLVCMTWKTYLNLIRHFNQKG